MKAVLINQETTEMYVGDWEEPTPSADELLVSVKATALNRADLLQRRGMYPPPAGASPILGLEMAGIVEQVGANVTDWKQGDRVCALLPGGGYAEKVTIPAGMAIRIPEGYTFEQAAAIPEVFLTAYLNLFVLGKLQQEETVLIHAGASGVGTAAIQLVREFGATSIVTAGSDKKREACLALGASVAIDYHDGPFVTKVKEATGGIGVNVILDFVGASYWEHNLESLAPDGRLVLIGTMGGNKVKEVDILRLMARRLQIIGSTLRSRSVSNKIELTREFTRFASPLFDQGRLKPIIDSVWDVSQVNEAHQHMEKNQNVGKIVLQTNF